MDDPTLVLVNEEGDGLELVVNFGLFAGRDVTPAEVDRLAEALLPDVDVFDVVCEQRYRFDREREAMVHQVRIRIPPEDADQRDWIVETVEAWAKDCIADRRLLSP
jgi:hypothetical protein